MAFHSIVTPINRSYLRCRFTAICVYCIGFSCVFCFSTYGDSFEDHTATSYFLLDACWRLGYAIVAVQDAGRVTVAESRSILNTNQLFLWVACIEQKTSFRWTEATNTHTLQWAAYGQAQWATLYMAFFVLNLKRNTNWLNPTGVELRAESFAFDCSSSSSLALQTPYIYM